MIFKVTSDLPGYLRVRFGAYAFDSEEGYGIAEMLQDIPGILCVTTKAVNGSVLIRYDSQQQACKQTALELFASLDRLSLPRTSGSDAQRKIEITRTFKNKLASLIGSYFLRRLILPLPLQWGWTVFQSFGFIVKGLHSLMRGRLTVEVLDATAITASLLQGTFSSAGTIMLMLNISVLLEEYTHARSRIALEESLAINVDQVWLVTETGEVSVSMDQLREGDHICVRTGSMIPVDGKVSAGEAAVNEASMTGESKLVVKHENASVYAGTVVADGSIIVRVNKTKGDTRIAHIIDLIDESEKLKAGVQSRAEHLADEIVPYSFFAFFVLLATTRNLTKAMAVLMVDYSCAIKLSTPVAIMSAMREAAKHGMVVKGGRYLEAMAAADTIVFDKTGTLTVATPAVERVISFGEMPEREVLRFSACLEEHFPHSVARAVVEAANRSGILHEEEKHTEIKYVVAHGLSSTFEGKDVLLGSAHFVFNDEGVKEPAGYKEKIAKLAPGASVIYLAINGKLEAALCISDPVREDAKESIKNLHAHGFKHIIMLTGDAEGAASVVAQKLGIDEYRSQVLPEDKADIIADFKQQGHRVVMVGDGINDSPALARADVSIAMIDASDLAREVADIMLLKSSLEDIETVRVLSTKLMNRIERNYRIIVTFNTALIVAGVVGVLVPTTSALLHNLSTLLITLYNTQPLLSDPIASLLRGEDATQS